jgi:hypothetical protein
MRPSPATGRADRQGIEEPSRETAARRGEERASSAGVQPGDVESRVVLIGVIDIDDFSGPERR